MTLLPSDLAAVIEAVTAALPDWDHTQPAAISSISDHVWTHPTEREQVTLSHYATGTRWLVQVEYTRGGALKSLQVLDNLAEVPVWLCAAGATSGRLSLAGAR
jgi:hypothetical protein